MARYNNVNVKLAGLSKDQIEEYKTEAKSGDYDNLLCVTMDYVCCS